MWTSQPVAVDLPWVPATARRSPPRVAIASAMSCWQLIAGMPAAWAAWSSGWSGSTEVSAFDTAIRSTMAPTGLVHDVSGDRGLQASGMPAAATASL